MVVQSTSPMFARDSYWCIAGTIKQAGMLTYPYHVYVPSFGEWGFVLAGHHEYTRPTALPAGLRFCRSQGFTCSVPIPAGHGSSLDAAESLERSGSGSSLRPGLEGHKSLTVSRRSFIQSAGFSLAGLHVKTEPKIRGAFVNESFQSGAHASRSRGFSGAASGSKRSR